MPKKDFALDWELVSGRKDVRDEADPRERYRIYRLCPGDTKAELIATCASEKAVGVALCELGRGGEFSPENGDCAVGVLDTMGEVGKKWIFRPWLASPKNVSDAAKVMASAKKRKEKA